MSEAIRTYQYGADTWDSEKVLVALAAHYKLTYSMKDKALKTLFMRAYMEYRGIRYSATDNVETVAGQFADEYLDEGVMPSCVCYEVAELCKQNVPGFVKNDLLYVPVLIPLAIPTEAPVSV